MGLWSIAADLVLFSAVAGVAQPLLRRGAHWGERVALGAAFAMGAVYSGLLLSQHWSAFPWWYLILGVLGLAGWWRAGDVPPGSWRVWLGMGAVCVLLFVKVMLDPLWAHDARSIWFFHAKILYFQSGWGTAESWQIPDQILYHFHYPKLVAALAAHTALISGQWNEYIPKLPLLGIWIAWLAGVWALPWARAARCFLGLGFLGTGGSLLWTGYMDGHLAALAVVGILHWACGSRWVGVALLSLACWLKAEGLFIAISWGGLIAWETWRGRKLRTDYAGLLVALMVMALWEWRRRDLGLIGDIHLDSFTRGWRRLIDGSIFSPILGGFITDGFVLRGLVLLVLVVGWFRWTKRRFPSVPRHLAVLFVHAAGVFFVYLNTPYDLAWHVSQSAARVSLPLAMGLIAASAAVMHQWSVEHLNS